MAAFDIEPGAGPFRWNLVRQYDLHGTRNLAVYRWEGSGSECQRLRDIFYTPPAAGGEIAPTDAFAYHVALSWEVPLNAQPQYTHVDKRRHQARLRRVAISSKTWAATGPREFVRAYNLAYFPERSVPGAAGEAPIWGRSSLKSVQMEGRCASPVAEIGEVLPDPTSCAVLPPVSFEYQQAELTIGTAVHISLNGPGAAGQLDYVTSTALVDINRDGLPDLVQAWPANFRRPSYKFEYNECKNGDFVIDSGADPQNLDPQLSCRPDDITESVFDIRSARKHDAWLNGRTGATIGLDHRRLDAGGAEPGSPTYYQVAGPHGYDSREPSLRSGVMVPRRWETGATAPCCGASRAMPGLALPLPSAGPSGRSCARRGYAPAIFLAFCPEAASKPDYPALRWKKMDTAGWAKNAPGQGTPEYRNYTIVDIDGDGYADLLTDTITPGEDNNFKRAAIRFTRKISELESTIGQPGPALYPFSTFGGEAITVTSTAGYSTYADIDGDGIADLVTSNDWIDGGGPRVRPGDGRGGFGCDAGSDTACRIPGNGTWLGNAYPMFTPDAQKPWPIGIDNPYGFAKGAVHFFHDVTGDGLDDIVAYTPPSAETGPNSAARIQLWVNLGRGQFRCANTTDCVVGTITGDEQPGRSRGSLARRIVFADIDGNGTEDFVLIGSKGIWSFSFLAAAPVPAAGSRSPRPGLLTRVDNGVGAITEIVYETTQELDAKFADDDSKSFHAPWTTHIPVVVPIVTRISTRDVRTVSGGPSAEPYLVNRTTHFEYRDPAYDPWERSFKGFQRVRTLQPSG